MINLFFVDKKVYNMDMIHLIPDPARNQKQANSTDGITISALIPLMLSYASNYFANMNPERGTPANATHTIPVIPYIN